MFSFAVVEAASSKMQMSHSVDSSNSKMAFRRYDACVCTSESESTIMTVLLLARFSEPGEIAVVIRMLPSWHSGLTKSGSSESRPEKCLSESTFAIVPKLEKGPMVCNSRCLATNRPTVRQQTPFEGCQVALVRTS